MEAKELWKSVKDEAMLADTAELRNSLKGELTGTMSLLSVGDSEG